MTSCAIPTAVADAVPPADEQTLIDRIRGRDVRAFRELYFRYHGPLRRFLLSVTRQPQIVDDLVNDSMMVIWDEIHTFRPPGRLPTWIYGVAYRKALGAIRQKRVPAASSPADQGAGVDPTVAPDLERQRVERLFLDATGELSPDHRAVVEFTHVHGMHYRDIAKIMKCRVGRVSTLMLQARRHIRRRSGPPPGGVSP